MDQFIDNCKVILPKKVTDPDQPTNNASLENLPSLPISEEFCLQSLDKEHHCCVDWSINSMLLCQSNHPAVDEVNFRLPLFKDVNAHRGLVLLSAGNHLLQYMISLLSRYVNPLCSCHGETLSHQKISHNSRARGLKHLTKAQVSEGGHRADG